jgi:hypothetical protein
VATTSDFHIHPTLRPPGVVIQIDWAAAVLVLDGIDDASEVGVEVLGWTVGKVVVGEGRSQGGAVLLAHDWHVVARLE